ncbi:glycosyltransferase family 2 protein [Roseimaritima sediminicola]|uniref:glycosyltransferase family 2 protein n=1 Tax=Roseimaritima sediminicola TaxID=2662066 RepID=UPI0012983CC1|nr:glycosyltransferase family 2 protein [Roseimaritima sediminicola]
MESESSAALPSPSVAGASAADDPSFQWTDAFVDRCEKLWGPSLCERMAIYRLPAGFCLTVIVPVFNEVATIAQVVSRLERTGLPLEIILVDDGSTDGSGAELDRLAQRDGVRALHHDRNRGKGAALRSGLQAARGDCIVIQDGDLEYDPEDFRLLLQPWVAGQADVVYGTRYGHSDRDVSPWWHQAANGLVTGLANLATGLKLSDVETCYKLAGREVWQAIVPRLREDRFGFEIESTAYFARQRLRFAERPIRYHQRWYDEGKKIGWKDGVRALWCIFLYGVLRRG